MVAAVTTVRKHTAAPSQITYMLHGSVTGILEQLKWNPSKERGNDSQFTLPYLGEIDQAIIQISFQTQGFEVMIFE